MVACPHQSNADDCGNRLKTPTLLTGAKLVDHRDGNGLNNRRANLRPCDKFQNMANTGGRGGTSEFKGVSWRSGKKRWAATIGHGGRIRFLGYFMDEAEAARAYDAVASRLQGDFARLNFPDDERGEISLNGGETVETVTIRGFRDR